MDRFPTKPAMLTFLRNLLYNAETGDLAPADYVDALGQAVDVLEHSTQPVEAVATLRGYQAYIAGRESPPH